MPELAMISSVTLLDAAKVLAAAHRAEDPQTSAVFLGDDPHNSAVRLVEVSGSVESTGEVLPFRFRANPGQGVPFESVIILLSDDEWQRLTRGELRLPDGWGTPEKLNKID